MSESSRNKQIIIGFLLLLTTLTVISPLKTVQVEGEEKPRYGGWLTDCVYRDADVLNPVFSSSSTSSYIENFIFESLLTYDKDGQFVPELALSWDISPNKHIYTMYLREDVYWHDNVKFTADDVIFTWERIMDPRTPSTRGGYFDLWNELNPFEKVDDYTIKFHLECSYAAVLNCFVTNIIPKHIFEPYCPPEGSNEPYKFYDCPPNVHPIGTGSMMFDEWIRDNQTVLIRNSRANGGPGYWREHDAYLDGVIVKVIPEVTTQILALKNGEIDKMDLSYVEPSEVEGMQSNKDFTVYTAPTCASEHIAFNCDPSKGHHADNRDFDEEPNYFAGFKWQEPDPMKLPGPNIRKALNYAFDKEYFISVVYPSCYRNKGPVYLAHVGWYRDDVNAYDFNITKANELLGEAGFGYTKDDPLRKLLNFTLSRNSGSNRRSSILNYAKGQWETRLGIGVKCENVEWVSMLNSHFDNRMFDAMSAGWTSGGGDPSLTSIWHSKYIKPGGRPIAFDSTTYVWKWEGEPIAGGLNYAGYWNPEVDNLLDIARNEPENTVRKIYYDQIQEKIVDDCPYIWLVALASLEAVRSNIHGMIHDSIAGLWPQPIGFHNVWKSASTDESSTSVGQLISGSSTTSGVVTGDLSSYVLYLLPMLIIGGFFVVGGVIGTFIRKR